MEITDRILEHLPWRKKTTPSGWISFNAVCCHHNGQRADDRGRGGVMLTPEGGITYHCFNCHYSTGWQPGRRLSYKMRRWMQWLGISTDQINRLALFALSQQLPETQSVVEKAELPVYESREPCPGRSIISWLNDGHITEENYNSLEAVIQYLDQRGLGDKLDLLQWTEDQSLRNRVLVPFTWNNKQVGFSGRSITMQSNKVKYFSNYPSNMVWGYDRQSSDRKFIIVVEGLLDAVHLDCIAVCSNEINPVQAQVIESLDRDIIVVPDRDRAGRSMVEVALKYGWSVAFPDWLPGVKDVADACVQYGRLFTMRSIIMSVQDNPLKIQLLSRKWFDNA
jgi:hypothetical protein